MDEQLPGHVPHTSRLDLPGMFASHYYPPFYDPRSDMGRGNDLLRITVPSCLTFWHGASSDTLNRSLRGSPRPLIT